MTNATTSVHSTIYKSVEICFELFNSEYRSQQLELERVKSIVELTALQKRELVYGVYSDSKTQEYLILLTLALSTYIEASVNFTLSYVFSASVRSLSSSFKEKIESFTSFCPRFQLTESEWNIVNEIVSTRNSLVHHKPEISIDGQAITKGTVSGFIYLLNFDASPLIEVPKWIFQKLIDAIDDPSVQWRLQSGLLELRLTSHH